ncbi:MAG: glycosyl hydrolase, partial [Flavobacteriaceae bacterium]|nr:glycosyl hydrolase [Flavobacteriaceae bacterium]
KTSEHIGKIIVHPENSDIVYVAAIGPLWNKGKDRGLYKTIDGGKNWKAVLTIDEHTGVNDVVMDPRDSNVLYASAHQRRRHVFTYVGGGPGSGIHKSTDGGDTWIKINSGLPKTEMGRIGLAISPANPEIIYAIVEAANSKGGFYRSTNRGASWEKRSKHVTSGNYYQEIIADPIDSQTIYSMNNWMKVSHDGGKTFKNVGEDYKHIDNHCMWIDSNNNQHWLVGSDGGIYETFDAAKHWDFKQNLPVTQFYKVAVDNDEPFYNVYGGTQDNFSLGGPSRVITDHGITNYDWIITHGGDGFESQVDPDNPDIVYAQSQYGWLVRFDRKSGEEVGIKPNERENENAYRWNWDSPLAVSKHETGRLYFAANKLFRSDDYGNSWNVISEDLTRQIDRNTLKVYDRIVSIDAVMKNGSTSPYGTIVALSESPLDKNLIAIGTDDGLIQITENGGNTWRKIDNISGAPKRSYINNVYLSQHNVNVMYAAFNHHKYGDFKPYIFKSTDKGKTWKKISNNLDERGSVYSIEEDPIDKDLIFCGTEFGVYFSPNGGKRWKKLKNGLPTVAVRDIAIQQRENDLVLATFGRGFYVLDDYSSLRHIENNKPTEIATIYPIRDALMWEKSLPLGLPGKAFQGDNFFTAENLGPEAMITYFYNNDYKSLKEKRQEKEKKLIKKRSDANYPNYNALKAEVDEIAPKLVFTIKDASGKVIKKVIKKPTKGLQRFKWNLRYEEKVPINLNKPSFYNPFSGKREST